MKILRFILLILFFSCNESVEQTLYTRFSEYNMIIIPPTSPCADCLTYLIPQYYEWKEKEENILILDVGTDYALHDLFLDGQIILFEEIEKIKSEDNYRVFENTGSSFIEVIK